MSDEERNRSVKRPPTNWSGWASRMGGSQRSRIGLVTEDDEFARAVAGILEDDPSFELRRIELDAPVEMDLDLVAIDSEAVPSGDASRAVVLYGGKTALVLLGDGVPEQLAMSWFRHGVQDVFPREDATRPRFRREVRYTVERSRVAAQFRGLISENVDAMAVLDRNCTIQYVNRAFEDLYQQPASELLGQTLLVEVDAESPGELVVGSGAAQRITEVRVSTITWEDQPALLATLRDITERRLAHARLAQIFEAAPFGMLMVDGEGQIQSANSRAEKYFGADEGELAGRPLNSLVQHEEAVYSGTFSVTGLKDDGTTFPAELRVAPVELGSETLSLFSVLDITQRIEAEQRREELAEQLSTVQKLEGLGRLAGGIAHDFNNILSIIRSYTDFVMGAVEEPAVKADVEVIADAGTRAAALTNQLLAFSKRQVMRPRLLNLNHHIREMDRMLRSIIGEHIRVETHLGDGSLRVRSDPSQLEQILMNLCVNARDAMPEGGELTIETRPAHVEEPPPGAEPGDYVVMAVQDTGVGIEPGVLNRIFEPFYTTKGPSEGTGLGLSTVYGIVSQSGGYLDVESEPGEGTTFRVYLPRVTDGADDREKEESAEIALGGDETVLVVEDDELVRITASRILERAGYQLLEATNGREAIQLCNDLDAEVDLILTDVVMPGMGGVPLVGHLQEVFPDIKVVFMSGYADEDLDQTSLLQRNWFVEKPFTSSSVLFAVRGALDDEEPPA